MVTFTPNPAPTYGPTSKTTTPRILETKYGDGYRQRMADGINSLEQQYEAGWENITTAEKNALIALFVGWGGWDAFSWTIPGDSLATVWTCKSWKETPKTPGYWDLSASFQREFDV